MFEHLDSLSKGNQKRVFGVPRGPIDFGANKKASLGTPGCPGEQLLGAQRE